MKIAAIILFVLQGLSLIGTISSGGFPSLLANAMFFNGVYGFSGFVGYMFPSILGCILLGAHNKRERKKNTVNSADLAKNPNVQVWMCSKCGTANLMKVKTCQSCGVSKQWSDEQKRHSGAAPAPAASNWLKLRFDSLNAEVKVDKNPCVVGTDPAADLNVSQVPGAEYVSANHAQIVWAEGAWYIKAEATTNGTYMNGYPLEAQLYYPLSQGDVISFGGGMEVTVLDFFNAPAAVMPAPAAAAPAAPKTNPPKTGKKKLPLILLIAAAVVAVAVLIGAAVNNSQITAVESSISDIGTVRLESEAKIETAEALYANLSQKNQTKVDNYGKLVEARKEYDRLTGAVEQAKAAIDAIGTVTADSGDAIAAARSAYDALEADGLTKYLKDRYPVLQEAETVYTELCAFNEAQALYENGNYAKAAETARNFIQNHPQSAYVPDAHDLAANCGVMAAQSAFEAGALEKAIAELDASNEQYQNESRPAAYTQLRQKVEAELEKIRPENGKVFYDKGVTGGYSKFTVKASSGSDAYVKLENIKDPNKYAIFYVRAGSSASIKVKEGHYNAKYVTGPYWFGEDKLFGSSSSYTKADKPVEFNLRYEGSYVYYSQITITLYSVLGGNLSTSDISPDQF